VPNDVLEITTDYSIVLKCQRKVTKKAPCRDELGNRRSFRILTSLSQWDVVRLKMENSRFVGEEEGRAKRSTPIEVREMRARVEVGRPRNSRFPHNSKSGGAPAKNVR